MFTGVMNGSRSIQNVHKVYSAGLRISKGLLLRMPTARIAASGGI